MWDVRLCGVDEALSKPGARREASTPLTDSRCPGIGAAPVGVTRFRPPGSLQEAGRRSTESNTCPLTRTSY